jgi:hypothetical protein
MAGDVKVTLTLITVKFSSGLSKMAGRVLGWGRSMVRGFGRIGRSMMSSLFSGAKWAVAGGGAALGALIYKSVSTAGTFEQIELQFQTLFKSAEKAKGWVDELRDLAIKLPVELEDLAQASRLMEVFAGGVLNTAESLTLLTDMASATNQEIESVAFWVGRAYSMISAGRPFGEAAMRLQEMGLVSGTTRNELEKLTKAGASSTKIWETLKGNFMEFAGASEILQSTWKGRLNKLSDSWKKALGAMGDEILIFAKTRVDYLANSFEGLADSGWAAKFGRSVRSGMEIAEKAAYTFASTAIPEIQKYIDKLKEVYKAGGEVTKENQAEAFWRVADVITEDVTSALIKVAKAVTPYFFDIGVEVGKGVLSGMAKGISGAMKSVGPKMDEWFRNSPIFGGIKKHFDMQADLKHGNISKDDANKIIGQEINPFNIDKEFIRELEKKVGKGIYRTRAPYESMIPSEVIMSDLKNNLPGMLSDVFTDRIGRTVAAYGQDKTGNPILRVVVMNTEELKAPVKTQSKGGY